MTFKELYEEAAKTGELPSVRYHGPKDKYVVQGHRGRVREIKHTGLYAEIAVHFEGLSWRTHFYEQVSDDKRLKYMRDLKIILSGS